MFVPLIAGGVLVAGCGGDDEGGPMCAEGVKSATLIAPQPGQMLGPTDDADLDMPRIQYDVRVSPCGFEIDEEVVVWLLEPVSSAYAFIPTAGDEIVVTGRVSFIPGENSLVVRTRDEVDVSDTVSFTVSEE